MASTSNVIILPSSSPERIFARSPTPVAYSPERLFGFPPRESSPPAMRSPSTLFQSPSRCATTNTESQKNGPENNKESFGEEIGGENLPVVTTGEKESKGKLKRVPKKKTVEERQTVLTDLESVSCEPPKSKATKKTTNGTKGRSRTTSKREVSGNKTLKGRVSKGDSGKASGSVKQAAALLELSEPQDSSKKAPNDWEKEGLQLEEATKRRLDWTPTKDSAVQVIDLDGDDDGTPSQEVSDRRSFGDLFSSYGFNGEGRPSQETTKRTDDGGPTKKRRIELVDSNIFQNSRPPQQQETGESATVETVDGATPAQRGEKKTKPQKKKKMTTITARATARYVPDDKEKSNSLRQYFTVEEEPTSKEATKPTKRKPSKAKRKKSDESSKTTTAPECIVLSPEAAFKKFDDQDLLFGTWSQLERDESPTLVRETQMALRASESIMTVEQETLPSQQSGISASTSTTVSRFTSSRNLWSVAARDLDGFLVQAEVLDMVDSPGFADPLSKICDPAPKQVTETKEKERQEEDVWVEIDDRPKPQSKNAKSVPQPCSFPPPAGETPAISVQPIDPIDHQPTQPAERPAIPQPEMPRFGGFTDAELAKQIAAYGFKPVKGRDKMIELLQKCWESKHPGARSQNSASSKTTNQPDIAEKNKSEAANPSRPTQKSRTTKSQSKTGSHLVEESNQSPPSQQRGRGRKKTSTTDKKATTTTFRKQSEPSSSSHLHHVEEIEDSEDELIPSPSRLQRNRHSSRSVTPLPLTLSGAPKPTNSTTSNNKTKTKTKTKTQESANSAKLPDLSTQITKAIHAQPRMRSDANGRKRPTWHEKILMYDPIVLEDLAAWLNTEGLGLVGEDREVSAGFVREWCESRGICCCWKKNDW